MLYADRNCVYTEEFSPIQGYRFSGMCIATKKQYSVFVPAEELYRYRQGDHIQEAMPSVSAPDREFLMTGISPEGWVKTFHPDEEEEEGDE